MRGFGSVIRVDVRTCMGKSVRFTAAAPLSMEGFFLVSRVQDGPLQCLCLFF